MQIPKWAIAALAAVGVGLGTAWWFRRDRRVDVKRLFAEEKVAAVCFDVDSTIATTEGIDEFANFLGVGAEVAALTKKAMEGGMAFEDALEARLSAMKITRDALNAFLKAHVR